MAFFKNCPADIEQTISSFNQVNCVLLIAAILIFSTMYSAELRKIVRDLYQRYKNYRKVADLTRVPLSSLHRIINEDEFSIKKQRGPKKKLKDCDFRHIKRIVHRCGDEKRRCTSRVIKDEAGLSHVSTRTIRRAVNSLSFVYKKPVKEISLTAAHKEARMKACREWIESSIDWKTVIFTDEKRFSLDGPDNWSTYIDPERKNVRDRVRCGGGGFMIWGMITSNGLFWIKFLAGKVDSKKYIELLGEAKAILDQKFGDENYIFQQDNCSIHTSKLTSGWIKESRMEVLEWPARSPDLNLIENMWSYLSDKIYSKRIKFDSKNQLRMAIERSVTEINENGYQYIDSLFNSMNKRCLDCIEKKGSIIDY